MFAGTGTEDGRALWLVWQRAASGYHHHVMTMDTASPEIRGVGGVYLVWHLGSPPEWVTIGQAEDLGAALEGLRADPSLRPLEDLGGLYATWVELPRENRGGVVRYLADLLKPLVDGRRAHAPPIRVNIPH